MRRILVTADDFGLTDGVTRGIVETMTRGIVTSTSAMMAAEGAPERVARAAPSVARRIGLHLQLTGGHACASPAEVATLCGSDGEFPCHRPPAGTLDPAHVAREWAAQAARFASLGLVPDHLDSHHHVHHRPDALEAFVRVAAAVPCPCRGGAAGVRHALRSAGLNCPDRLESGWRDLSVEGLLRLVDRAFAAAGAGATVELMCHPGFADEHLAACSRYVEDRERELAVLCDPATADGLRRRGIALIGWQEL